MNKGDILYCAWLDGNTPKTTECIVKKAGKVQATVQDPRYQLHNNIGSMHINEGGHAYLSRVGAYSTTPVKALSGLLEHEQDRKDYHERESVKYGRNTRAIKAEIKKYDSAIIVG